MQNAPGAGAAVNPPGPIGRTMGMMKPEYDLCVIGGGAAGLVVAAGGAGLGAKVLLVEKHRLGGDCLYYGCVPSKTLLKSAKVFRQRQAAAADLYGLPAPAASGPARIPDVMRRVQQVIAGIEPHDSPERFRSLGVEVLLEGGKFIDPRTFEAGGRKITARRFVLATGSRPVLPPIPGLDRVPCLTNETVFSLGEDVPSLVVVGAGPIGCELAQAFARLGTRVAVIAREPRVLMREDADAAAVVQASLEHDGIAFELGATPVEVSGTTGRITTRFERADGSTDTIESTHLLVAAGRAINTEGLGLAEAGVEVIKGRITNDERLRTTNHDIFVAGDAAGRQQFTHVAEHHAGVVLRNALFHLPAKVESRVVPWCTFTEPEIARVGLSEAEASAQGLAFESYRFDFADLDRARAEGETDGFARILTDRKGRLLGATLVGAHAGEAIAEYALAMAKKMKASDISGVIHVYPTFAQINRRVADQRLKASLTPGARRWIRRLFGLRGPQ
jgi:pyruvate/2-oxoglutarate dehydrogenase complex dihydrolipoamide dehydrogenase (E3) component